MKKQTIFIFIAIAMLSLQCAPRYTDNGNIIRIKGSDTMYILAQSWAENYMKANPGISIYCEGGGTATGTQALASGTVEISTASRPIRPEEGQLIAQRFNSVGVMHRVAKDALSIYIHPSNPVNSLTMEQLKDIYTGKINNWREVGGLSSPILKLNRIPNSGTHLYFKEHVMDGEPYTTQGTMVVASAFDMMRNVKINTNAIGYGGFVNDLEIKLLKVNNVEPLAENVLNDTYPITRYLYLYTANVPQGEIKKFIEWVLGPEGQLLVKQAGFFPLWE